MQQDQHQDEIQVRELLSRLAQTQGQHVSFEERFHVLVLSKGTYCFFANEVGVRVIPLYGIEIVVSEKIKAQLSLSLEEKMTAFKMMKRLSLSPIRKLEGLELKNL